MMNLDLITTICSLLALATSIYALVQSNKFHALDKTFKEFAEGDLKAKQAPRIQVCDELLAFERSQNTVPADQNEPTLNVKYSSVLHNKGTEVAEIASVTLQVTPIREDASELEHGLGSLVIGTVYLAPGESISLSKEIGSNFFQFVRNFFAMENCPLLIRCVYRYSGYAGQEKSLKVGLLMLNEENKIQAHSNWRPPIGRPRSYPLR